MEDTSLQPSADPSDSPYTSDIDVHEEVKGDTNRAQINT